MYLVMYTKHITECDITNATHWLHGIISAHMYVALCPASEAVKVYFSLQPLCCELVLSGVKLKYTLNFRCWASVRNVSRDYPSESKH